MIDQRAHGAARAVVELAARILPLHPRRAKHVLKKDVLQEGEGPGPGDEIDANRYVDWLLDEPQIPQPPVPPETPSLDLPASTGPADGGMQHAWQEINSTPGSWRCTLCGQVTNTGQLTSPEAQRCPGVSRVLAQVGRGHRLVRYRPIPGAPDMAECFSCLNCCRTATSQQVFAAPCDEQITPGRRSFYNRVERGLHPHPRHGKRVLYAAGELLQSVGV